MAGLDCLSGGGKAGALLREINWSTTPLGPVQGWPLSLQAAVRIVLSSQFPMMLHWGPELTTIYNDAYAPGLGRKHPGQLGRPAREWWSEMWDQLTPIFDKVLSGGTFHVENARYTPDRDGVPREAYFTHGYSPLWDDEGQITGIFLVVTETTRQVVAERDLTQVSAELAQQINAARASEARLGALVRASSEVLYSMSADWTEMRQLSGGGFLADTGTANSHWIDDYIPETEQPRVRAAVAEAIRQRGVFSLEHQVRLADGGVGWTHSRAVPLFDPDSEITEWIGTASDITPRKRAEEELRDSEARLRALMDQSSAGIAQTTLQGRFIFVNDQYCALVGRSRDELLSLGMQALTHPEDLPPNQTQFESLARGGRSFEVVKRYLRPDGSTVWVRNSVAAVHDAEGRVGSVFAVSLDINEQKLAEMRQAFLLRLADRLRAEDTPGGIIIGVAELLGRYLRASRVGYGLVQPDGETIVLEPGYRNGVSSLDGSYSLASFDAESIAAQQRGQTVVADDTRNLPTSERWVALEIGAFVSVPLIRDGHFRASFYINHRCPHAWSADEVALIEEVASRTWDAVERARAEAALRDANDTLEQRIATTLAERELVEEALRQSQKMEAIGQLTGGVAHDFNNLLTVIRSSIDLLKRPGIPEDRRTRYVTAISDTVERAAKLTGQLLAFARRQALKPETFAACDAVRMLGGMLGTLTGSRIEVVAELPEVPCFVNADPSQFDTALVNMAVNARDAINGEGRLTIRVAGAKEIPARRPHAALPGNFVAVSITDTGSGIAADQLERIFEPFYTTKEQGKGTGLGLSQVYGFAKQSGGEVIVESRTGVGSTFTIFLPRVAAPEERPAEVTEPEPLVDGHGTCVLVVEDNIDVGDFATQALAELGYEPVLAVNAEEALAELAKNADQFDVVFSDVVMPGMSGIELGQRIRQNHRDLPVVLTSGYSHVLAQNGTYGFELLHKPYSIEQLSRVLRRVATWQRRRRITGA
ncbi:PAS domain S-box protein [Roseomonas nepalensis]|uniref:histidine kinase n=1 Tax=Muricoccus nepalensis TaxID=1854500 RepID=A0A502EXV0_9PROT|nr:PAS domain S-box protein [Roseomonas nepalensis]TPG41854.1 PAS domain S-box protein [Roseomonas nepalensis]